MKILNSGHMEPPTGVGTMVWVMAAFVVFVVIISGISLNVKFSSDSRTSTNYLAIGDTVCIPGLSVTGKVTNVYLDKVSFLAKGTNGMLQEMILPTEIIRKVQSERLYAKYLLPH